MTNRLDKLRELEIKLEAAEKDNHLLHTHWREMTERAEAAEAALKEIGEFFPICGEEQCRHHHTKLRTILDKLNET